MEHQEFWSTYQPGFRFATAPVGTAEFFQQVSCYRDSIESHIPGVVRFARWAARDVLEAGCGIGTDGSRFAAAGARYTGMDFSPTALSLARRRFELEGLAGRFVGGSVTALPFADASFDLVFSHGVIHHTAGTQDALGEFYRVLRPGGTALVMVYHRTSFNYHVSIMMLRRALVSLLMVPGGTKLVSALTREPEDVLQGHVDLLDEHGLGYIRDRAMFLSRNTDGPGNALAKVYTGEGFAGMLSAAGFGPVTMEVRYLNLRLYPGGLRFSGTGAGRRLERRFGWHLYAEGKKPPAPARSPLPG